MHTNVNILDAKMAKTGEVYGSCATPNNRRTKRARRLRMCALDPLPVPSFWRVLGFSSALPSAWLRALTRMIIARSHAP